MKRKCLLTHSFYNASLAEEYVLNGKGLGFLSFFVIAVLTGMIYAVKVALFAAEITPPEIQSLTSQIPQIEIQDGQIVEPKNFFGRIRLTDGVHITLDTTDNSAVVETDSPSEIYISKNAVHFINGNRMELMPLSNLIGTKNATITQEQMHTFIKTITDEMYVVIPLFVFVLATPVLFFKYVIIAYFVALLTYLITLYPRVDLSFESRMRLAAISTLPVFIINMIFGTLFSWFTLGAIGGVLVVFVYLFYYLMQLPKEMLSDMRND